MKTLLTEPTSCGWSDFTRPAFLPNQEYRWLNVTQLCEYLPSHPKKQTIYSWTSKKRIPYHKKGRSIMFDKGEIDAWLLDGEHFKSESDIEREAKEFVINGKRRG